MKKGIIISIFLSLAFSFLGCNEKQNESASEKPIDRPDRYLVVLGVAQDAGYPQANCRKACCQLFWQGKEAKRFASCLGIVDEKLGKAWMIDATPDFKDQLHMLLNPGEGKKIKLESIFLTHAHIGHYTGLIHLGREVMGANAVPVYAMPRMRQFLTENGPWSQLVQLENIHLESLASDSSIILAEELSITPTLVPHREEYAETVGFKISSKNKSMLFIPDINKWHDWDGDIREEIKKVDYAFLDATFYKNGEIPGRDMSEIPHPFIEESMALFSGMSEEEKAKVHFIHFNHTNPVLRDSKERNEVQRAGYNLAKQGQIFDL